VVDALDKLQIPYMVVGSFSSNVYGKPRSTKDADFVIQLDDKSISTLAAQIGSDFVLDPQTLLPYLKKLRRNHRIKTWSALIGGVILPLVGPMLITLSFLMISLSLIGSYGFWGTYCIIAAVSLPICFLIAYLVRGSVLERWVPDGDTLSGRFMRRTIAPSLIILEIANIGPRLVIWSINRFLGHNRVLGATPLRVAQCLAMLMSANGGVNPAALLRPGEPADHLEPLLAYLLYNELVDLSKRGDRVWLISHIRNDLENYR
jgi:hypothetical protein